MSYCLSASQESRRKPWKNFRLISSRTFSTFGATISPSRTLHGGYLGQPLSAQASCTEIGPGQIVSYREGSPRIFLRLVK
jgi:hypothetical protein